VRARPGKPAQGWLRLGPHALPCALGRSGISAAKREGDGATPLARMRLLGGYFRTGQGRDIAPGRAGLPMRPIARDLGWCDAPQSPSYNRPVRLPFPAGHERMSRPDRLYDAVLVLDWNIRPRVRNRGSAIFLHLARPGFAPTEGCIAVSRRTMSRLLAALRPGAAVRVLR
jgi:L,D-peptidoglycan transpeptidase YkuD (ErfK/YbiS/YcfS/YnhG family)